MGFFLDLLVVILLASVGAARKQKWLLNYIIDSNDNGDRYVFLTNLELQRSFIIMARLSTL